MRVDGEVKDLVPKMQVDRYKIHDIEVVIDRLAVTDDMKTRLSSSVQKALQMGKNLLFILLNDDNRVLQYSKQLMCEDTGISYEEPSPNSFSFNSPYGACPTCKGLGAVYQISMEAVIPDRSKSINEGGIAPLGEEREAYMFRQVQQLAKKNKFSLDTPIGEMPKKALNLVLYGNESGDGNLDVDFGTEGGGGQIYTEEFEGLVNSLSRWFGSSTSDSLREWVEKFMELTTCETCGGTRLRKESLWFRVGEKNIAELSAMNLNRLADWFSGIDKKLNSKQNIIAKDILKEIRERLQFLLDVGLTYLTLDRPSRTLSGGESQRIRLATQIGSQLQGITYILDEPSIGLHQRDNQRLIHALKNLRDIGNSVLVVEHDKDIMLAADYLVDIGPMAGLHGGRIVAQGRPPALAGA